MKGVLGQAEKLVLHNDTLTRTMAQIGQTVRIGVDSPRIPDNTQLSGGPLRPGICQVTDTG